jgi:hypothetical protein
MPSFTYTRDIPFSTNNPSNDQPIMQTNTNSIDDIIKVDHFGFGTLTQVDGYHKQVSLVNEAAPGVPANANGVLFTNTVNLNSWPIWQNAAGIFSLMSDTPVSANPGRLILPGGITLQWGTVTGTPIAPNQLVTFSTPFLVQIYSIVLGAQTNDTDDKTINIVNGSLTLSQFKISTSNTSSFQSLSYMAIGV